MARRMMPAEVKRMVNDRLLYGLPPQSQGYAIVTPRDENGRRCAAWQAHHYEVFAYPIVMSADLEPIAEALHRLPGASGITLRTLAEVTEDKALNPVRPGVFARLPVTWQEVA